MAKSYDNPIDKHIPWDGNDDTGGLPVRGRRIEEFLKKELDSKAGVFYYDGNNNRHLVFADIESRDKYIADPTNTSLILGSFDAPYEYKAEINLISPIYNAVALGSKNNYVEFTFDFKNSNGASTKENASVSVTVKHNSIQNTITSVYKADSTVRINIDNYLSEGTNTVTISVTGQTSLATTTMAVTYQVIALQLSDNLNISKVYNISNGSAIVEVPYSVSGYGTKILEWYLDGVLLDFVKSEDEVVEVSSERTKYIELSNLSGGTHSLQFRVYTNVNGEDFYSDTLYRDLIVTTGEEKNPIIGIGMSIPNKYGILGPDDAVTLYDMTQFVTYQLQLAAYNPLDGKTNVSISLGDQIIGTTQVQNFKESYYSIQASKSGNQTLKLNDKEIIAVIAPNDISVNEITSNLVLDFNTVGRTNQMDDKDSWSFGNYSAIFNGFKWNNVSGWYNNRLLINKDSSLYINFNLADITPTSNGMTFEMEWKTKNVYDDDAVICDMLDDNGTGLFITATKVMLVSRNKVTVETNYKADETVRIAIVVNRSQGSTNKCMTMLYCNGIVSRCEAWPVNDNYNSKTNLYLRGSENAEIELKQIRVYNTALNSDNVLNNYILYRDSLAEMLDIYNRNDIYNEGSYVMDYNKMSTRLPVMIITGDIPTLEDAGDTDVQITVDIEYINNQDPTRSFTMKNAVMKPQGTSSMGYPKKNFRIYTEKRDDTVLRDYNGQIVEDKLYSFKENAQPVNCWCLKADYAESSGTHNTGIARLWNEALRNAQITHVFSDDDPRNVEGEYLLRTNAQQCAIDAGYKYDVRTAIDGFPILLFYRLDSTRDLIFIGKYNFNNDKSTESVFGFVNIPNFDNTNMQCWEALDNGDSLSLFTNVSNFDERWSQAFESRYPDTKTPNTSHLKAFCEWMANVTKEDFLTEKWEHLDVWKMAAYYIYLMRHAGADQFVKNSMLTSEDGQKFYYILYDNDTINGLINTGHLRLSPTVDRNTKDDSGSYVLAGHDSRLWNMLEDDAEFFSIVKSVDEALSNAGITYSNVIKMFDTEQADKWVEKVYNQDAQYKYISPYVERGTNNLFMLQGKRDLHRKWWLAKRFAIYDAKYVSPAYTSKFVEIKVLNGTEAGREIKIVAGEDTSYGWGINRNPKVTGIELSNGDSHTFVISKNPDAEEGDADNQLNVGDPIRLYCAHSLKEIDFSDMSDRIVNLNVTNVFNNELGTKLNKLIIGSLLKTNKELTTISGLQNAEQLSYLDVQGIENLVSLDLSKQIKFNTLKAKGSGVTSVVFAEGAPVELLELPKLYSLTLKQLPILTTDGLKIEDIKSINYVDITECPKISNSFSWVWNWYNSKTTADEECTLIMDNIDWSGTGVTVAHILEIANVGTLSLQGKVTIPSITLEEVIALRERFGNNVFKKGQSFYIEAPAGMFLVGPTEVLEGESAQYEMIDLGDSEIARAQYKLSSSYSDVTIDSATGLLTTVENGTERTLEVILSAIVDGELQEKRISLTKKKRVYPQNVTITGNMNPPLGEEHVYRISTSTQDVTGNYETTWSLTESDDGEKYAEIVTSDNNTCIINVLKTPLTVVNLTLSAVLKKVYNQSVIDSPTFSISIFDGSIAETDPEVCRILHEKGLCANAEYITKEEAKSIVISDLVNDGSSIFYSNLNIKSFNGFKYFTNVKYIPEFRYCGNLRSITLPPGITKIPNYCFYQCDYLSSIELNDGITDIGYKAFGYTGLTSIEIPDSVTSIGYETFKGCKSLISVTIPALEKIQSDLFNGCINLKTVTFTTEAPTWSYISQYAFAYCKSLESIEIPEGYKDLYYNAFAFCSKLKTVKLPSTLNSIGSAAFHSCSSLEEICIPKSAYKVDRQAFILCGSVDITVDEENTNYCSVDGVLYNKAKTDLIAYAKSAKQPEYKVLDGVTNIANSAFQDDFFIEKIILPDSVLSLGTYCFSNCKKLHTIVLPSNITTIPETCFNGCISLSEITIPASVTTIDRLAFSNCSALKTIYCLSANAPSAVNYPFGGQSDTYTGRNTYSTGENKLYVPQGATGYDTGQWLDPLCNEEKCGFTLVYSE